MAESNMNQTRLGRQRWARWASPMTLAAAIMLALVAFVAMFGPLIWGQAAEAVDMQNILSGSSAQHWLGTDGLGRDLFARTLVATQLSVLLALGTTAISLLLGLAFGSAQVLFGRVAGNVAAWLIGVGIAFPGLLLALFFAVIFGTGPASAVFALGLAGAPSFARLCQTLIAGVVGRDFVAAARVGGVSRRRILVRHILPNIGETLVVNATIGAGGALLAFAGLSFLGIGVQLPSYDWGRLMGDGLGSIYSRPLGALGPGLAVLLAGLAFNLTGESVARALGLASLGQVGWRGKAGREALAAFRNQPAASGENPAEAANTEATASGKNMAPDAEALLSVRNLRIAFPAAQGAVTPVRGVSLELAPGSAVGLVGESGSGKSLTALALARLLEEPAQVQADRLVFDGVDLLTAGPGQTRHLLGTELAMVFQDPMTSLNPTMRVGPQLAELGQHHGGLTRAEALARAVDRLAAVRIPDAARRAKQYPHEFSGGMRQRAMIGLGVMLAPKLIIADEPTTALDVTVQEQVLDLLRAIRREDGVALLLISHDVSVVAEVCERVLVMYAGRLVEDLAVTSLRDAAHPYTRALIAAAPTMTTALDQPLATIPGRAVEPGFLPVGCPFAPRCDYATELCHQSEPSLTPSRNGSAVACFHPVAPKLAGVGVGGAGAGGAGAGGGIGQVGAVPAAKRAIEGAIAQAKASVREAVDQTRDAARSAVDQVRQAVLGPEDEK